MNMRLLVRSEHSDSEDKGNMPGHETTDSQTDKEDISGKMITTNLPTQGNSCHISKLFAWKLFLF